MVPTWGIANGKAKTAWGKAYSERFKQLKREWDRTKKVGGATVRTWKSAFTALGRLARKHADSKATTCLTTSVQWCRRAL